MEYLKKIKARCAAATPGPWRASIEGRDHLSGDSVILTLSDDIYLTPGASAADHDFIAHARQDIEFLVYELEKLLIEKSD
jgi:hypothetical protein